MTKSLAWFFFTTFTYIFSHSPLYAADIEDQIAARLAEYHSAYPDIEFVRTFKGAPLTLDALRQKLGPEPDNLDYEHPAEVREDLMEAQFYRIERMLDVGMPSSTLFKRKVLSPQYVCVITLDPKIYKDVQAVSRFLFDVDAREFQVLKPKYRVSTERFVSFVLDHEIFHCLYSREKGFTYPRTGSQTRSSYDQYYVEMQADLYARSRYIDRYPGDHDFLSAVRHYKVLSLIYWDLPHYTIDAFDFQLESKPGLDIRRRVAYIIKDVAKQIKSYDSYQDDLVSDFLLVQKNFDPGIQIPEDMPELFGRKLVVNVHLEMVNQLNATLSDLFEEDKEEQD